MESSNGLEFNFSHVNELEAGEPSCDFWDQPMIDTLQAIMADIPKKKQQYMYEMMMAVAHGFYRHGFVRGCYTGAIDAVSADTTPSVSELHAARRRMISHVTALNREDPGTKVGAENENK